MSELLMPSDVRKELATQPEMTTGPGGMHQGERAPDRPVVEPPSVKLIVRLFLIPLLIATAVIAVMIPIGWMTEGPVSLERAIERLKLPGGEKTLGLVGPASKQRYMDAKALVDHMKGGLKEPERIRLAGELVNILEQYTREDEGDVRHFVLLALGRVWQKYPNDPEMNSAEAVASRQKTLATLVKYFDAPTTQARKAAILALAFWQGRPEVKGAMEKLIEKAKNPQEDLDVRIAAVVTLGNVAEPSDQNVMEALDEAMLDTDPKNAELVWNATLSLAQFNRPEAKETVMRLLRREELAQLRVYDRETDPKNPVFRGLNDEEQQRFLMNAMERAHQLKDAEVQGQLQKIAQSDPSRRVRLAATEILAK